MLDKIFSRNRKLIESTTQVMSMYRGIHPSWCHDLNAILSDFAACNVPLYGTHGYYNDTGILECFTARQNNFQEP
jgi:hypothetical protein